MRWKRVINRQDMKISFNNNTNYIWRIVFTILIALLHAFYLPQMGASSWYLGVDYFFIVSAVLMCKGCEKKKESTLSYMMGRVERLWPAPIIQFLFMCLLYIRVEGWEYLRENVVYHLCELIPFVFYWNDNRHFVGGVPWNFTLWYIAALFATSIVVYYLYTNCKKIYLNFIAPIAIYIVFTHYYVAHTCVNVNCDMFRYWDPFMRAFADMSIGCLIYILIIKLSEKKYKKSFFVATSILELLVFTAVIYITYDYKGKEDVWIIMLIAVGVLLSFIHTDHMKLDYKPIKKLNNVTYSVYVNHMFVMAAICGYIQPNGTCVPVIEYLVITFVFSFFTEWLGRVGVSGVKKFFSSFVISG